MMVLLFLARCISSQGEVGTGISTDGGISIQPVKEIPVSITSKADIVDRVYATDINLSITSDDVIKRDYTPDGIFTKVDSANNQCLGKCESILTITDPYDYSMPLNKLSFLFLNRKDGMSNNLKKVEFYIEHTYTDPNGSYTYNEKYAKCVTKSGCDNYDSYDERYSNCTFKCVTEDVKIYLPTTWTKWIPLNDTDASKEIQPGDSVRIKIIADKDINTEIDWIPAYTFEKKDFPDLPAQKIKTLKTDWAWWSSSWSKRMNITIGATNTQTNYQVNVTIIYDADMRSDFGDVRFTDRSGHELYHFLVKQKASTYADYYVNVSVGAAKVIDAYYGNAGATDNSNGPLTFYDFDHFDAANLDASQWDVDYAADKYTLTGSALRTLYDAGSDNVCTINAKGFTLNKQYAAPWRYSIVTRMKINSGGDSAKMCIGTTTTRSELGLWQDTTASRAYAYTLNGGSETCCDNDIVTNRYVYIEYMWTNESTTVDKPRVYMNSTFKLATASNYAGWTTTTNRFNLMHYGVGAGYNFWDWVGVRKNSYPSGEPTITFGGEQTINILRASNVRVFTEGAFHNMTQLRDLNCSWIPLDSRYTSISANVTWFKNTVNDPTFNSGTLSCTNGTVCYTNKYVTSPYTSVGDIWNCSVIVWDTNINNASSNAKTIVPSDQPSIPAEFVFLGAGAATVAVVLLLRRKRGNI